MLFGKWFELLLFQGERLLTMSCSDKVARWNVVGVQGSLLCHFVEPIYLHSIVVGSLFNSTHMYRAVCGRVESCLSGLPPPFRLNKPLLTSTSSPETRQPGKTPNHSVNWTLGIYITFHQHTLHRSTIYIPIVFVGIT
jgi:double stranded RNA-specific editase B